MANAIELATVLVTAWLDNPNTRTDAENVLAFLGTKHAAIVKLASGTANAEPEAAAPPPGIGTDGVGT